MTPRTRRTNTGAALSQTLQNVQAICELERRALARRSRAERFSDTVAYQAGRLWFIVLHALWFGGWVLWNSPLIPGGRKFDPFPFPALTAMVSLEAIFLSLFILMSQNRNTRQADERAHLDLQVNLLAERESTKMLQLLQALCKHHKLPEANDPEVAELSSRTKPEALAREIQASLPQHDSEAHQASKVTD